MTIWGHGFNNFDMFDAPSKAPLPWMLQIDEGKWTEFSYDQSSVVEIDDDGPEEKWNAYRLDIKFDGEDLDNEIVPFHAMQDFYDASVDAKAKKGWVEMEVKRRKTGEKNKLQFRQE